MPIPRTSVTHACFAVILSAATACADLPVAGEDPAATVADARVAHIEATTPVQQVSDAYGTPAALPTVVVRDASGAPLPDARVQFLAIGPMSDTVTQQQGTDADGRATMPAWRLGVPARYVAQVRAGNVSSTPFSVVAMPSELRDSSMRARCPLSDSLRVPFTALDSTVARLRSDAQ